ncbi:MULTISPECIES: hypothetical protein [Halorubrum]|uniref:Uncharacterized protein n=1 Tax=Halorubrum sodomense TaxID=35743 RepID=A0A1I6GQL2_HALSD|nr:MULTISPECIES: hypothetical protein [Halorubrum]TKX55188.1 hypothetical protein EXE42_04315 [Halorubrum sp. SP3]TKX70248.1 hypothetical protein EXE45_05430 [Halorubrum sp. SP9]SFR44484.1 hypothetical protein SAMN04487937_1967 [Halorubrum sodomense]
MRPRTLPLLVALLLSVTVLAAAPPVDARAPPTPVCGVCELDRTTPDGDSVVAGESSLTVTLHGNGSSTWEARVHLAAGGDALAANGSLRRAVVTDAVRDGIADPKDVDARVDGDVLAVDYRDPNATERHLGAVVFTPLTPASPRVPFVIGGEGSRYLGADRLTVRGEPGWEVRGDAPGGGTGDELVWSREDAERDDAERVPLDVDRDPVAVEAGAMLPGVRAWIARLLTGNGF